MRFGILNYDLPCTVNSRISRVNMKYNLLRKRKRRRPRRKNKEAVPRYNYIIIR